MSAITAVYRDAWRFVRACPGLFLLVVAVKLAQHLIEYRAGFYDSLLAMKAAESDGLRMAAGHVKVLLLFAVQFWALRFYAFGHDPAAPTRRDPAAWIAFLPVVAWGLMWLVVVQDGAWAARAFGWDGRSFAIALLLLTLVSTMLEIALSAWKTSAATGSGTIGFLASIRATRGSWLFALNVSTAAILPAMSMHYGFAFLAIGRDPATSAGVLLADSLLVGIMGPLMAGSSWVVARRVAAGMGRPLVPAPAH